MRLSQDSVILTPRKSSYSSFTPSRQPESFKLHTDDSRLFFVLLLLASQLYTPLHNHTKTKHACTKYFEYFSSLASYESTTAFDIRADFGLVQSGLQNPESG